MPDYLYKEWKESNNGAPIEMMCDARSTASMQFHFRCEYLNAVELALTHLYAERTGNWLLYVDALQRMIPYFFQAVRVNYFRWLSVHVYDLLRLEKTHPSIYEQFCYGRLVVNRTRNRFSAVSGDHALEQTLNKDVKCDGGLIGQTKNSKSRLRWFLTSHLKAKLQQRWLG